MSVLIKEMEMPKSCVDCRFHKSIYCTLTDICTNTAQGCPLVPVPPHGRLIDADALIKELEIDDLDDRTGAVLLMAVFLEVLKSAPTIIPAEPCNNLSKPCKEDEA